MAGSVVNAFKQRVVSAFDGAEDYDRLAAIQQEVAKALAGRIASIALPQGARVLEVGCGTGFLADAVGPLANDIDWLMTDISPAMLERSRARLGQRSGHRFALLDGEHPRFEPPEQPFDLICSSLAVQWLADLPAALGGLFALLRPGGHLLISTLAKGTFAEWQAAHAAVGQSAGTPAYPTPEELRLIRLDGVAGRIEVEQFITAYASGRDFLRALRGIGAGTPRPGHRPLPPQAIRGVLKQFETAGARITWNVAFCCFQRPPEVRA